MHIKFVPVKLLINCQWGRIGDEVWLPGPLVEQWQADGCVEEIARTQPSVESYTEPCVAGQGGYQ